MTITQLYELLETIPKTGAINIARRRSIIQQILKLEKEAGEIE